MRNVRECRNSKHVIEVNGNGKSQVEGPDVMYTIDVFTDRALPRVIISVGANVEAEVTRGRGKGNVVPLGTDVKNDVSARGVGEAPNGYDVGFGDFEVEVGCIGDGVECVDKGWEGTPKIGNDEGSIIGISGENVGTGEGRLNIAKNAISDEEINT